MRRLPHLEALDRIARHAAADAAHADDLVQEACLRAVMHFDQPDGDNKRAGRPRFA